jgi:hypothetical protein
VLREAGVVRGERRGTWIWYGLEPGVAERLAKLAAELAPGSPRPATSLAAKRSGGVGSLPVGEGSAAGATGR